MKPGLQSGTSFQPVSPEQARCPSHSLLFMESLLSLLRTHWDHEPDWHPSPCPLPARRGEGGRRPGEGRFMGRAAAEPHLTTLPHSITPLGKICLHPCSSVVKPRACLEFRNLCAQSFIAA